MPTETRAVAVTVPLLFLLVTQLSSVARDMDLKRVVQEQHTPLGFPPLGEWSPPLPIDRELTFFPRFGRFNFLHGINTVILVLVLVLVSNLSTGAVRGVIAMIAGFVWLILPALEIDEYDELLETDRTSHERTGHWSILPAWWHSLHTHVVCVVVTATLTALVAGALVPPPLSRDAVTPEAGLLLGGVLVALAATYLLPLHQLQRELSETEKPSS